jgi:hypothetical protein
MGVRCGRLSQPRRGTHQSVMRRARVLFCDDDQILRDALAMLISSEMDRDGQGAIRRAIL